jgi:hypothetical protein
MVDLVQQVNHAVARLAGAQRAEVPGLAVGMGVEGLDQVRGGIKRRASLRFDQAQRFCRIVLVLQDDRRSVRHERQEAVEAVAPEQRDHQQEPVLLGQVHALADGEHVLDQSTVQQGHALRACGRTRGEQDQRGVFGPHLIHAGRDGRGCHPLAQAPQLLPGQRSRRTGRSQAHDVPQGGDLGAQIAKLLHRSHVVILDVPVHHHQHRGIGQAQSVLELVLPPPCVQGDDHTAEHADGELHERPFQLVAHQDGHAVAAAHPQAMERSRQGLRLLQEFGVAHPPLTIGDEVTLGMALRHLREEMGKGSAGGQAHGSKVVGRVSG